MATNRHTHESAHRVTTPETRPPDPSPPGAPPAPRPSDAAELLAQATRARAAGQSALAEALYRRIQAEHASSREALVSWVSLGRLALAQGRGDLALASFRSYRTRAPQGPLTEDVLVGIAESATLLGRPTEATQAWRELLERFPASVHQRRARAALGDRAP